jgi:hypothetical protein
VSNTRHAAPGSPLSQERFASSFHLGVLANLVAKRLTNAGRDRDFERPEIVPLVWFAQWCSWQPGGLSRLSREMRESLSPKPVQRDSERQSVEAIQRICLDPNCRLGADIGDGEAALVSPDDWSRLARCREKWISELATGFETTVGRRAVEALDYTQNVKCLTLIDGPARIGKSFSARRWCERSAGLARYVEVPCSNDDMSFYRAIGRALGVSSSLQLKAAEIRARVEETLEAGYLMLVLDEAHYLWPQNWQRYAMPSRVNWVMTACVNRGVPVALITTPLFHSARKQVERLTTWNSTQFIGRIGHFERLPERLDKKDLLGVAESMFPEGDDSTWSAMAAFSGGSQTCLASIDAIVKRARWFAGQSGRGEATAADVRRVMKERISTFDNPLRSDSCGVRKPKREVFAALPRGLGEMAAPLPRVLSAEGRGSLAPT